VLPVESEGQAARRQLEKVLASPGFARNERLSRFLRFVVDRHLDGRDGELKESLIGIEVFGRIPGYDPKKDPIVRTEASRLRARLSEYYVGEGKADLLVIELPKGGYLPALKAIADERESTPKRQPWNSRTLAVAAVAAGVVLIAAGLVWWRLQPVQPIAIAVLPLDNLSHDPANDYFSDGLTDELIRNLSLIEGLAPRSRTSSFAFKGKPRNAHEVGKELAADYILEGSVLRAGQQLRIDAQLIRVRDDFPIWSGKFDRELTDVFAIQDEISRGIVNSLRVKLGAGRRRYETSIEAYDFYLRGRALPPRSQYRLNQPSIPLFKAAIAKDPSFAPAYAGIASVYAYTSGTFPNLNRREDQLGEMRAAAEKAIQLDPLMAEGHAALAMAYARDGKWEQSEKSFRRAIELDPNRSTSYGDFALYVLLVLGRTEEALHQLRIAEKTDPLSSEVHYFLAYTLTSARRYDEAAAQCEKLPEDYPAKSECLGRARLGQGRIGEAIQVLAALADRGNRGYLGYAYARAGRREDAEKIAADVSPNPFNQALVFAGLGDRERTLEALERMDVLGPVRIGRALTFPEFAFVRGDPRIRALRMKIGLPE
jgi:TolB-like protein/Flp pilus assembly protein TadD